MTKGKFMKYIIASALALIILGANPNSSSTTLAAPEQCLDIYTSTWGGCGAINAGLPEPSNTGGGGGGSKGLYLKTRAAL